MADIDVQCPECKAITSVSQFATPVDLTCVSCGCKLEHPGVISGSPHRPKLTMKQTPAPVNGAPALGYLAMMKPPERQKARSQWKPSQHVMSWIIFIVLAGAMGFIRYSHSVDARFLNMLATFAPFVVAAFHVLAVLKAFQDSVFQGILCLLVPFYSFIYLLLMSDDYYARAVFAGLMVGMAQDAWAYYQSAAIGIYNTVSAWLRSGG